MAYSGKTDIKILPVNIQRNVIYTGKKSHRNCLWWQPYVNFNSQRLGSIYCKYVQELKGTITKEVK